MQYVIEKTITSLNEYIKILNEYRKSYNEELWFRGQVNNHWLLDASINRDKKMNIEGEVSTLRYKNILNFIPELDVFKSKLGMSAPEYFNDFHYTFLGQHYNLKTPALDWTLDPLVALFFALNGYKTEEDIRPIIFILRPCLLNSNCRIIYEDGRQIRDPLIIDDIPNANEEFRKWYKDINAAPFSILPLAVKSDKAISHRISRQSGVFTMMSAIQPLSYPWIQTEINREPIGIALEVDQDAIKELRNSLDAFYINRISIYGSDPFGWEKIAAAAERNSSYI